MVAPRFLKRLLGLKDPRKAASLVAKGVVQARDGNVQGALASYRQAIEEDDTYALARLNVALALQDLYNEERQSLSTDEHQARLEEMHTHLREAVKLDPELTPAYRALGFVERLRGDYEAAVEAFETYVSHTDEKDPHRERVNNALEEVREKAATARAIQDAITAAEKISEVAPDRREQLMADLRQALARAPDRADGWWAMGVLRRAAGDVDGAVQDLTQALTVDRECMAAHKELASLNFHAGKPDAALPHAKAAYDADPTNPALVCNLGVCHLALGQLAQARDYIHIARGLAPKDPIVQDCLRALEEAEQGAGAGRR
ncbi:MAG: tetratricopeptide repeat protein [Myxococcota bacterium]